jgi:hypothetical protein
MQDQEPRGWWSRNWKWAVPVGCLGSLVIMLALCGGLVAILFGSMKSSWACTEGVNLAVHNKRVIRELGEPIKVGWLVSGSISVSGPSGEADLSIPLSGPRGHGTLYVFAHKRVGEWNLERAEVEIYGQQERIDLLADKPKDRG